ncbi:MAG: hypothetical protein AAB883_01325 [Patescibacteria group bacterium]
MNNTLSKIAEFGLGDISDNAQLALAKVSDRTLGECGLVGLTGETLERALAVSADHKVGLEQIVGYMKDGISLERVNMCLEIYVDEFTNKGRASVYLLNCYADAFGFSMDGKGYCDAFRTALVSFQSFFEESLANKVKAQLPLYWLYHAIQNKMGGEFHKALCLVNEDPSQMVEVLMSRTGVLAGTNNPTFGRHCNEILRETSYCAARAAEAERRKNYEPSV